MSAGFVLGSSKSSTYPRGYASGFDSPTALLDKLFKHPAGVVLHRDTHTDPWLSFSTACPQSPLEDMGGSTVE
jgi:hypothetical protein